MKNTILKFLTFSLGSVSAAFFSLITTPIVTRLVIPEEYGQYSLFLLLSNIFIMLALFGLDQAITRFYFEVNVTKLYFQVYKIFILSFIFSTITMLIVIYLFDFNYFKNMYILLSFVIFMISSVNFRIQNLKLRMEQKALLYSLMVFISKLIEFIFTLTFIYFFSNDARTLITGIVISMLLSNVFNYIMNKRYILFKSDNETILPIKDLLNYSYPLMISGVFTMVFQVSDKIVLNYFGSQHEFGIYTASFKLAALLTIIQQAFSLFWTPYIMKKYSSGENVQILLENVLVVMKMLLFGMFIILVFIKDYLILFLGSEYRDGSIFLPFFYFLPIMYVLSEITIVGVYFNSKTKKIIFVTVTTLIVSLFSATLLTYFYNALGASISLAITYTYFFVSRTKIGLDEYRFKLNKLSIIFLIVSMFIISIISLFYNELIVTIVSIILFFIYIIINFKELLAVKKMFRRI